MYPAIESLQKRISELEAENAILRMENAELELKASCWDNFQKGSEGFMDVLLTKQEKRSEPETT